MYKNVLSYRFYTLYTATAAEDIVQRLLAPREAANILGISYPTLKQWIYRGKSRSRKLPAVITAFRKRNRPAVPTKLDRGDIGARRGQFRKISGRNQLIGRVVAIKYSGIPRTGDAAFGEQQITSIITADAAKRCA
jgi:hypothetical protein